MWQAPVDAPPPTIPAAFGLTGLNWRRASGGFSGAAVWCGEDDAGKPVVALKCWPQGASREYLAQVHHWMAAAGFPFVPSLFHTGSGQTVLVHNLALWDATAWLPGAPSIPADLDEVEAAVAAAAELHGAWSPAAVRAPSPGIRLRIEVLERWLNEPAEPPASTSLCADLLARAATLCRKSAPGLLRELRRREAAPLSLQPCLRDLRGEHVLFTEKRVTGIVDYGAMAVDSPVLDVARLLGDLAGPSERLFVQGLEAYRAALPTSDASNELASLLLRAGVVASIIRWLVRVGSGETAAEPQPHSQWERGVAQRLLELVERAERLVNPSN